MLHVHTHPQASVCSKTVQTRMERGLGEDYEQLLPHTLCVHVCAPCGLSKGLTPCLLSLAIYRIFRKRKESGRRPF